MSEALQRKSYETTGRAEALAAVLAAFAARFSCFLSIGTGLSKDDLIQPPIMKKTIRWRYFAITLATFFKVVIIMIPRFASRTP